jgi:hypothetical protein
LDHLSAGNETEIYGRAFLDIFGLLFLGRRKESIGLGPLCAPRQISAGLHQRRKGLWCCLQLLRIVFFLLCLFFQSLLQVNSLKTGEFISKFTLDIGTVVGFSGKKKHSEIFYHFVSFLTPGEFKEINFTIQV